MKEEQSGSRRAARRRQTKAASPGRRTAPRRPRGCLPTARDLELFRTGRHCRLAEKLGAHPRRVGRTHGVSFAVWAPSARRVSVIGDFNDWDPRSHPLQRVAGSGVWSVFAAGAQPGALYKFHIESAHGQRVDKSDPFAFRCELPPETASQVWELDYDWGDAKWIAERPERSRPEAPMSIYEVHLGSWKRPGSARRAWLGYRELADQLIDYVDRLGFTHVELLPPLEHPFYGSWGYQPTAWFAPTGRYGSPQDLMFLIDRLHRRGIGVILDWVPSHFPGDQHGLAYFDGAPLFEYADPRTGYHPDWKTFVFDYGRPEVRSFLISSALFWIERYHVDAIRVDAVASMLYLDYSRPAGQWVANVHGGRENLEAISFLRQLNDAVHERHPDVKMIAEESTAWPMVSRPVYLGGLGFDMKWDMGWMHDSLAYMQLDPVHRKFHQDRITFRMIYAFSENFVLPLSHDEVVYGKGSLLRKMWGDEWQRFANLRALLGYMYAQPGKKLLFMGNEIGQWGEWDHERSVEWQLLEHAPHAGLQQWVADLNRAYRTEPALHELDFDGAGFRWVDCSDADRSILCLTRHASGEGGEVVLVVCNFTPVPRRNYRVGVPVGGDWSELLNSDAECYGGSGVGNLGLARATPIRYHGLPWSLCLTLPPLSTVFFRHAAPETPIVLGARGGRRPVAREGRSRRRRQREGRAVR